MYTHPFSGSQLDRERHQHMRVQVGRQRLARQLHDEARASRRAGETQRVQRRAWRSALRLRARAHA
jgi:hypothetical protein